MPWAANSASTSNVVCSRVAAESAVNADHHRRPHVPFARPERFVHVVEIL